MCFSSFSAGNPGRVHVVDVATGTIEADIPTSEVNCVAVSPDGRRLLVGHDGTVRLWTVGKTPTPVTIPLGYRVHAVCFSSDGERFATAADSAQVWDTATGGQIGNRLTHKGFWVDAIAFSDDGSRVVTGGTDRTARVWQVPVTVPSDGELTALAVSEDGRFVGVGCRRGPDDETVHIWSADARRMVGAAVPVRDTRRVSDSGRIAFAGGLLLVCQEKTVALIDTASGREVGRIGTGDLVNARHLVVSPDGTKVVLCGGRSAQLWRLDTRAQVGRTILLPLLKLKLPPVPEKTEHPTAKSPAEVEPREPAVAAFTPSGQIFALGNQAGGLQLWDAETGEPVSKPLSNDKVYDIRFSNDGVRMVVSDFTKVDVWNVSPPTHLGTFAPSPRTAVRAALQLGSDSLVVGTDEHLLSWHVVSRRPTRLPRELDEAQRWSTGVSASGDQRLLLVVPSFLDAKTFHPVGPALVRGQVALWAHAPRSGKAVLAPGRGEAKHGAQISGTPVAVIDDLPYVKEWIELQTCQTIDPTDAVLELSFEEWFEKRNQLERRGRLPFRPRSP